MPAVTSSVLPNPAGRDRSNKEGPGAAVIVSPPSSRQRRGLRPAAVGAVALVLRPWGARWMQGCPRNVRAPAVPFRRSAHVPSVSVNETVRELLVSERPTWSFEFFPPKTPEGESQL